MPYHDPGRVGDPDVDRADRPGHGDQQQDRHDEGADGDPRREAGAVDGRTQATIQRDGWTRANEHEWGPIGQWRGRTEHNRHRQSFSTMSCEPDHKGGREFEVDSRTGARLRAAVNGGVDVQAGHLVAAARGDEPARQADECAGEVARSTAPTTSATLRGTGYGVIGA
ncbi:hypothetical protein GCM10022380_09080 [Amycolatopsis tucumanensis]|uniref:Uncharacterized protein n=1 Tax=Amycolatopsis tucumanensis TaxID=401106 RepID=A0ABP7HKG4_9PSEU